MSHKVKGVATPSWIEADYRQQNEDGSHHLLHPGRVSTYKEKATMVRPKPSSKPWSVSRQDFRPATLCAGKRTAQDFSNLRAPASSVDSSSTISDSGSTISDSGSTLPPVAKRSRGDCDVSVD